MNIIKKLFSIEQNTINYTNRYKYMCMVVSDFSTKTFYSNSIMELIFKRIFA